MKSYSKLGWIFLAFKVVDVWNYESLHTVNLIAEDESFTEQNLWWSSVHVWFLLFWLVFSQILGGDTPNPPFTVLNSWILAKEKTHLQNPPTLRSACIHTQSLHLRVCRMVQVYGLYSGVLSLIIFCSEIWILWVWFFESRFKLICKIFWVLFLSSNSKNNISWSKLKWKVWKLIFLLLKNWYCDAQPSLPAIFNRAIFADFGARTMCRRFCSLARVSAS